MKNYIVTAEMCTYLQVKIKANSQEEAEQIARDLCDSNFNGTEETGSWEIYNVEED